ncbi:MAG: tetratricopeptide repeat protein [Anaerolineaceae bacterium]|nr:tetratricopeptide repeat protein [Anaerolineaceae bacterium]
MPVHQVITKTKILVPQRRKDYLTRPRLLELLSDLLDFRLIIIAAPAGYGKTSLLVDFAHHFDWPVCWFALEPIDKDLSRFLAHFIYSIKQRFPEFGKESIRLLENTPADEINLDFLITTITNEIFETITEHFILVLDDYHLLQSSPKIDQFLSGFVQRADENCHVAITSRKLLTLPDLPLMVARSQVGGLSVEELAFQHEEILKLFNQVFKKSITSQEAIALAANTEGWITGLLLTSQTLKVGIGETQKATRASGIGLYEYLAQQVLEQQPYHIQDFLLNTSLLEEFDEEMCSTVIGNALSQKADWNGLMNYVIQNNLFIIPVGDRSLWLRYHHLFRDFLQTQIERKRPDDAHKIRLELANYHKKNANWEKVYEIYEHIGDRRAIADLVGNIGSEFIAKGRVKKLSTWLETIPQELYQNDPILLSIHASVAVNQGQIQKGRELLDNVITILNKGTNKKALADNLIRRSAALRMLGDYDAAMRDAEEAITLTKKKKTLSHLFSEALRAKGLLLYQNGNLKEGLSFLENAIRICNINGREEDTARILVEAGAIYETLGNFAEAEKAYERSLTYWQSVGDSIWQPIILNNLGVLQHSKGDFEKSFYNLEKSMHYSQATGNQRMEGYSLASIGDLYRDLNAFTEADDAYQKAMEIALIIEDRFLIFYLKTVQARISVNKKQLKKAQLQIRSAHIIAKKSGSLYEVNKCRLEQGALDFRNSHYNRAIENLKLSLDFFQNTGHIEDAVRNQFFLFLALIKIGELDKAKLILDTILENLRDPKHYVPSMSAANAVNRFLQSLPKKKYFSAKLSLLLKELAQFQRISQKNRHVIRKHASIIPFAPAKILIRAFGTAEVTANNHILTISDWKTQTSRDLFFLFLANPEGMTKEEVGIILWPDSSPSELKLRFKNAVYRMRHAIGSEVVIFQDGYYLFNRAVDYEYDVQNFISAIKRANEENLDSQKIEAYRAAIDLYKGAYLPQLDETWITADREKYLGMYTKAAEELAFLYMSHKEFEASLDISHTALKFAPFYEPLHRICMQVYAALGNKSGISRQYNKCRNNIMNEIGVEPSNQTTKLYKALIQE